MTHVDHGPRIYSFILDFQAANHLAPTVREMMGALDIPSSSTVKRHLTKLEGLGLLTHNPGEARSWRPLAGAAPAPLARHAGDDKMRGDILRLLELVDAMLPGSPANIRETWKNARATVARLRHEYGQ